MSDYLPANVDELSSQQRAALEETGDWRVMSSPSPNSLRGDDAQLHRVWNDSVIAGRDGHDVDLEYVREEVDWRTAHGGSSEENFQLVTRVHGAGIDFGRLVSVHGSADAVVQSRLNAIHRSHGNTEPPAYIPPPQYSPGVAMELMPPGAAARRSDASQPEQLPAYDGGGHRPTAAQIEAYEAAASDRPVMVMTSEEQQMRAALRASLDDRQGASQRPVPAAQTYQPSTSRSPSR
ncbi:hypothetical protein OG946_21920 [Streptomyces sp. NBC_01808]|uniref:hypothetical protein n=1 Tax=Streptomyces sp. NBC_01808 TaxID=2975947 RepID=UPI002DDB2820|nr:hypothetical protein [Streptomyces sp. NBC_01808]WSA39790.1 hypothetical protein OG946_21920 [Streptomyces sp. NBC_01808]